MTLREWRGPMSQDKLSVLLGISKRTLRRWETGRTPHVLHLLMELTTPDSLSRGNHD
jgi:DNA-binding transcriptional regulator YiaG